MFSLVFPILRRNEELLFSILFVNIPQCKVIRETIVAVLLFYNL